ncbi:MAG: DUF1648 domain-containing protein [Anaerolineae bacterium]|nr:DUF1648 domain-containing protein [Anaerolineae bacterium]
MRLCNPPEATVGWLYTMGFQSLTYYLDRNGLVVQLGPWRLPISMDAIEGIYASPQDGHGAPFRGLRLPGHNVGVGQLSDGSRAVFLATAPPEECLYVRTRTAVYALSPADPDSFLKAYEAERQLRPLRPLPEGLQMPLWLRALVWRDRLGLALTVGTVATSLLLLGMCFWLYPSLPPEVPMHFDALGRPDRMAPPGSIFYLPLVGSLVLFVNYALAIPLYRYERLLSYFLWGGAGLVQIVLILALRSITA